MRGHGSAGRTKLARVSIIGQAPYMVQIHGDDARIHQRTVVTAARGHCVRGVVRVSLRRQHDRREAIMTTAEGGIIQDDLLPAPEEADRRTEFLGTPARLFGQLLG